MRQCVPIYVIALDSIAILSSFDFLYKNNICGPLTTRFYVPRFRKKKHCKRHETRAKNENGSAL